MALQVNIKKAFGDFMLDVSFENDGRELGILGASGSGKSMTLRCIAGIETPDSGKIVLNERVLFDSEKQINLPPQKRRVGYLFQNYALFPNMTVEENIGAGIPRAADRRKKRIAECVEQFQLKGLEKRYPHQLSGGQQQRVALARILAYEPKLILFDEPFSAMDSFLKDVLQQQLLETLKRYNGDVIMVTHNRDEVYKFTEKLMVINNGKAEILGDTVELFKNPVYTEAAKLTGCKNISPIEKINAHCIRLLDWNVVLQLEREVADDIRAVGIRAHDLIPFWEKPDKNFLQCHLKTTAKLPFETHYYFETGEQQLCWFIQREKEAVIAQKGLPEYLVFPEEKLLFLK